MIYLHPILGGFAVATLLWIEAQGIRSRHARSYAPRARAIHRSYAKFALILIIMAEIGGTASVVFLRTDLKPTGSYHFWLGWGSATLASTLAWTGSQLANDPDARRIHPALGYAVLVVAALTFTLGLGLLP